MSAVCDVMCDKVENAEVEYEQTADELIEHSVESRNYKVVKLVAEGVRIEAPKGMGCGEGCAPPMGRSLGRGAVTPPQNNCGNIAYEMLQFGAYS